MAPYVSSARMAVYISSFLILWIGKIFNITEHFDILGYLVIFVNMQIRKNGDLNRHAETFRSGTLGDVWEYSVHSVTEVGIHRKLGSSGQNYSWTSSSDYPFWTYFPLVTSHLQPSVNENTLTGFQNWHWTQTLRVNCSLNSANPLQ